MEAAGKGPTRVSPPGADDRLPLSGSRGASRRSEGSWHRAGEKTNDSGQPWSHRKCLSPWTVCPLPGQACRARARVGSEPQREAGRGQRQGPLLTSPGCRVGDGNLSTLPGVHHTRVQSPSDVFSTQGEGIVFAFCHQEQSSMLTPSLLSLNTLLKLEIHLTHCLSHPTPHKANSGGGLPSTGPEAQGLPLLALGVGKCRFLDWTGSEAPPKASRRPSSSHRCRLGEMGFGGGSRPRNDPPRHGSPSPSSGSPPAGPALLTDVGKGSVSHVLGSGEIQRNNTAGKGPSAWLPL